MGRESEPLVSECASERYSQRKTSRRYSRICFGTLTSAEMAIGKAPLRIPDSDRSRHPHGPHSRQVHQHVHSLLLHHHGVVMPSSQLQHPHLAQRASVKLLVKSGLSREAAELKQRVMAACPDSLVRFSFSCMRRVVTPPVSIPPWLASPRVATMVVSGKRVPMTRAMWEKRKKQLAHRLPDRVDEQLCW